MIRFDQRQFDVQGTERVFKKVVHPGQNIRLVDKDGVPLKAPNFSALSRLQSQYVLSPRGVPTKRSNHSYSGQLAQSKLRTVVNSLDASTQPDMMSYASTHHYNNTTNGLSSAPSSQQGPAQRYMPGNLTPKKRAFGSGPPRSVKSMPPTAKTSASTRRSRYLTSAATTSQALVSLDQMSRSDVDGDKTNESPQGKRLEKEWSALSQCRALKRSSEIVSHRVDRMYFMTGSKLQIQNKYLVEEGDLQHLRELSQARASARSTRNDMREQAKILMEKREYDENDRLENIERKLSNIERRLSFIEEKNYDFQDRKHGGKFVKIQDDGNMSDSSVESGIHEDVVRCNSDVESELGADEIHGPAFLVDGANDKHQQQQQKILKRPVSRIQIRKRVTNRKESSGIQVWDILKHEKSTTSADTMLKLFETYPNVHDRARNGVELDGFDTVNALTLGIPRKQRTLRRRCKRHNEKSALPPEVVGHPSPVLGISAKKKEETCCLPPSANNENLKQNFPARKQSTKILPHPPVECDCRLDPWKGKGGPSGLLLSVTGTQVPLVDREGFHKVSKGDIYRPDRYVNGDKSNDGSDLQINGTEATIDKAETQKMNGKKKLHGPHRPSKSPLAGWAGGDVDSKEPSVTNDIVHKEILHDRGEKGKDQEGGDDAINETDRDGNVPNDTTDNKENFNEDNVKDEKVDEGDDDKENANDDTIGKNQTVDNDDSNSKTDKTDKDIEKGRVIKGVADKEMLNSDKVNEVESDIPNGTDGRVQEDGENQDTDGDKTVVKSEDYLDNVELENP